MLMFLPLPNDPLLYICFRRLLSTDPRLTRRRRQRHRQRRLGVLDAFVRSACCKVRPLKPPTGKYKGIFRQSSPLVWENIMP